MKRIISLMGSMVLIFMLCGCNNIAEQNLKHSEDSQEITSDAARIASTEIEESKIDNENTVIIMGTYEQDNNPDNGKEAIEWEIVATKDDMALVVSKYALDRKNYHDIDEDVTWETCSLRSWLNNDFFNDTFTDDEKSLISDSSVKAYNNPTYDVFAGNDTVDKVFILSVEEFNMYYPAGSKKGYAPTAYTEAKDIHVYRTGTCMVWLRNPGQVANSACFLFGSAGANVEGGWVAGHEGVGAKLAVCPAMWINYAEYLSKTW